MALNIFQFSASLGFYFLSEKMKIKLINQQAQQAVCYLFDLKS